MDDLRQRPAGPTAVTLGNDLAAVEVDLSVFELPAVLRACYKLTGRCHVFVARDRDDPGLVVVTLGTRSAEIDLRACIGELADELIDQQLRQQLAREAGSVREIIVAQAFAEGNLLEAESDEADYRTDPLGIGRRR